MDQGDFIRHRSRPEWGVGKVLQVTDEHLDAQFGTRLVRLKLAVAGPLLEKVSKAEAAASERPAPLRQGPARTASAPRRLPGERGTRRSSRDADD